MFGSPDAYNSTPAGNRRHDNRLKGQQKAYDSSKAAAESQGYVVQGDNKFKRVPDATSPNGFRLINQGKISVEKYGRTEIKDVKSTKPSAYTSNTEVKPSSFLKVETPTQNSERPTTPNNNGAEVPALGGKNYSVMGTEYDYKTGQAINPGTGKTSSDGYAIEPKTGGRTDYRGGETRVNGAGVVQKGTSTSPKPMTMDDANKLLSDGYKINTTYASNQLPTTASSPYAGKSNAQIYNPDTLHQHNSDVDYVSLSKNLDEDKSGVATYVRGKNMNENYKQMDVNPGESVPEEKVNWANRTMADNSDAKMARRRAFLDAKGSMQGLRDSEAVQGISYRGGNHYIADGKGGDSLTEVKNKDEMRTYKSGEEGARQIRDKYVNALTSKGNSVEYQTDAPAPLPDAVPTNSNIDKSQVDTSDLMDMKPSESIIGDNKPSRTVKPGILFNK